jgi:hypothetical protein
MVKISMVLPHIVTLKSGSYSGIQKREKFDWGKRTIGFVLD